MPYYITTRNPYSNELYHHGIKGQKWGIRRYQNPDGSLTPEGRKRYYNSDGTLTKVGARYARKKQSQLLKKVRSDSQDVADHDAWMKYYTKRQQRATALSDRFPNDSYLAIKAM